MNAKMKDIKATFLQEEALFSHRNLVDFTFFPCSWKNLLTVCKNELLWFPGLTVKALHFTCETRRSLPTFQSLPLIAVAVIALQLTALNQCGGFVYQLFRGGGCWLSRSALGRRIKTAWMKLFESIPFQGIWTMSLIFVSIKWRRKSSKLWDLLNGTWFDVMWFEFCRLFLFPSHTAQFSLPSDFLFSFDISVFKTKARLLHVSPPPSSDIWKQPMWTISTPMLLEMHDGRGIDCVSYGWGWGSLMQWQIMSNVMGSSGWGRDFWKKGIWPLVKVNAQFYAIWLKSKIVESVILELDLK